jgi:hypothetical protein
MTHAWAVTVGALGYLLFLLGLLVLSEKHQKLRRKAGEHNRDRQMEREWDAGEMKLFRIIGGNGEEQYWPATRVTVDSFYRLNIWRREMLAGQLEPDEWL